MNIVKIIKDRACLALFVLGICLAGVHEINSPTYTDNQAVAGIK